MSNLQLFSFEGKEVRTVIIGGEIWAVAKDVAVLLGYANTVKAIARHCKNVRSAKSLFKGSETHPFSLHPQTLHPQTLLINEGDINRLIFSSKLPIAEEIRIWWFEVVLPSIRKTGFYSTDQLPTLTNSEVIAKLDKVIGVLSQIQPMQFAIHNMDTRVIKLEAQLENLTNNPSGDLTSITTDIAEIKTQVEQLTLQFQYVGEQVQENLGKVKSNTEFTKVIPINTKESKELSIIVKEIATAAGNSTNTIWNQFKYEFGLMRSYKDLPKVHFASAKDFLQKQLAKVEKLSQRLI